MSFKPKMPQGGSGNGAGAGNPIAGAKNFPVPKSGLRPARIFSIIDVGNQNRPDFEEKDGTKKPQQPCDQLVIIAHLVNDEGDYGGTIGVQPISIMLNKNFKGDITGINFTTVPAKDGSGKVLWDQPQTFHPASMLTKLAKATGTEEIIVMTGDAGGDVSRLLGKALMIEVEVKETVAKNGKVDKDGNPVVYKNVNFKGVSKVPPVFDEDGNEKPMNVKPLKLKPRCITFDGATEEDIGFIRRDVLRMIKLANNYAGSAMEAAIQAYEAKHGSVGEAAKPAAPAQSTKTEVPKAAAMPPYSDEDDDGDGSPF